MTLKNERLFLLTIQLFNGLDRSPVTLEEFMKHVQSRLQLPLLFGMMNAPKELQNKHSLVLFHHWVIQYACKDDEEGNLLGQFDINPVASVEFLTDLLIHAKEDSLPLTCSIPRKECVLISLDLCKYEVKVKHLDAARVYLEMSKSEIDGCLKGDDVIFHKIQATEADIDAATKVLCGSGEDMITDVIDTTANISLFQKKEAEFLDAKTLCGLTTKPSADQLRKCVQLAIEGFLARPNETMVESKAGEMDLIQRLVPLLKQAKEYWWAMLLVQHKSTSEAIELARQAVKSYVVQEKYIYCIRDMVLMEFLIHSMHEMDCLTYQRELEQIVMH
jgi:hypothetical protein